MIVFCYINHFSKIAYTTTPEGIVSVSMCGFIKKVSRAHREGRNSWGVPLGPSQEILEKYQYALHLYNNKHIAIDKGCKQAKISKTSFYRIDKENNKL